MLKHFQLSILLTNVKTHLLLVGQCLHIFLSLGQHVALKVCVCPIYIFWVIFNRSFSTDQSSCGFESSCSHLSFRFRSCFEQGVPWHSGNYTAWNVSKYRVISGPYFPAFELNTERYFVSLRIQSECGKIRTRKNHVLGHFSRSAIEFGFTLKRVRDMIRTYSHKNRFFGFYKFLISQYLH